MFTTLLMIALAAAPADGLSKKLITSGATAKVGGYRPIRAELNDKAEAVKKSPEGLAAAKYGALKIGEKSYAFILDESEGKVAKLFVDTNRDGDLTNDPATTWEAKTNGGRTQHNGTCQIDLGGGSLATLNLYKFDPKDPQRAQLKNTVLYYTDYGYEITLSLDGKSFTTFVAGEFELNSSLWIDRDGNKLKSYKREMISVGKPFNFTGTTYVLSLDGEEVKLAKSSEALPIAPLPPDLAVGKKAPEFKMTAMDGKEVEFPKTYAGKIVMLDFWATWCGPCIAELPNVKKAYEACHEKGYEILGISFDADGMTDKLTAFTKDRGMPWRHLYEGKSWNTTLGETYDVSSIPFVLLVDGDTGEILATTSQLRGPGLTGVIEKALAKKNGAKQP